MLYPTPSAGVSRSDTDADDHSELVGHETVRRWPERETQFGRARAGRSGIARAVRVGCGGRPPRKTWATGQVVYWPGE
jgi:hypothetical protein